MNLTPKNNPAEFNQFLLNEIDLKIYQHKFLKDYVDKAIQGIASLYDQSVINKSQDGWIIILHGDILLVYGDNWAENQIQEISEIFDLNKYTNYTLAGEQLLIENLIKFYKPNNYEIEKIRFLYKATEIKKFNSNELQIKLGSLNQLNELAEMLQDYYNEEYNGLNDKSIAEMQERVFSLIQTEKIYVLIDNSENILSFCTIIDPDIGIMFTKREKRNNGYAKIILSYCSQLLQQKNEIVYVMTDASTTESNIVCEAVGFRPYFNYVMLRINFG